MGKKQKKQFTEGETQITKAHEAQQLLNKKNNAYRFSLAYLIDKDDEEHCVSLRKRVF